MPWVDKKIRTFWYEGKKRVKPGTPGAAKVKSKSKDFYGFWYDDAGKKKSMRFKHCQDRAVAEVLLRKHLDKLTRLRAGLLDPDADLTLPQVLTKQLAEMRARGVADKTWADFKLYVENCLAFTKGSLDARRVRTWVLSLSPGVRKTALSRVKTFASFAARETGEFHTVSSLTARELGCNRTLSDRRPFTPEEVGRLVGAARKKGLKGRERAAVYLFAVYTATRVGTIRKLKVEALDLEKGVVLLARKDTKSGRFALKPLHPSLVKELKAWVADTGKKAGDLLFVIPANVNATFDNDLRSAGIDKYDAAGRVVNFHCLKKSCLTWLAQAGAPVIAAQAMGEHTDPRMTLGVYAEADTETQRKAVNQLPEL